MQPSRNYSLALTNLMFAFKDFIEPFGLSSPKEYLEVQGLNNMSQISKLQFFDLIEPLNPILNLSDSKMNELFHQIQNRTAFISLNTFVKIYNDITRKLSSKSFKEDNYAKEQQFNRLYQQQKRKQQQKKNKKSFVSSAFEELQSYLQNNNGIEMFSDFDDNYLGKLGFDQLNQLLFTTGIVVFQNQDARKLFLSHIFEKLPSKHLIKEDFIQIFKLRQQIVKKPAFEHYYPPSTKNSFTEPQKNVINRQLSQSTLLTFNKYNQPLNNSSYEKFYQQNTERKRIESQRDQINRKHEIPRQHSQQTLFNFSNNNFEKKKLFEADSYSSPIIENFFCDKNKAKQDQFKKKMTFQEGKLNQVQKKLEFYQDIGKQQKILQAQQMFPNASLYYINEQLTEEQIPYLEQLEYLLIKNIVYNDKDNPYSRQGEYREAKQLFHGSKYKLFEMAPSVLDRQRSRIGMAQLIQPKDIMQGDIGDCYFLSALASMVSTNPELIYNKFLFKENPANYYVVKLFFNGEWVYIRTDDKFPVQQNFDGFTPCYAKPHGKKIWVMLIEKCWAKCFHSFQRIHGGWAEEVFAALTGAPTQLIRWGTLQFKKQIVFRKLNQAYQSGYIISISGSHHLNLLSKFDKDILGLVSRHAYSFLRFIEADGCQLIRLRNPWGKKIWQGDWSFNSNKWTKTLRDKFNYNKCPNDGSFYMNVKDFLTYFDNFQICKIKPNHFNTSLKLTFVKNKPKSVKIIVQKSGRYTLSLYQGNKRQMQIKDSQFNYSPANIVVTKLGKRSEEIGLQNKISSYATSVQVDLQNGCEYLISGTFKWKLWQSYEGCFTAYGPMKLIFKNADQSKNTEHKMQNFNGFFKNKINSVDLGPKVQFNRFSIQQAEFQASRVICKPEQKQIIKGFFGNKKIVKAQMLYRASENEFSSKKFHAKCDGISNTLTVIWTEFDKKVGGFTPLKWKSITAGMNVSPLQRHTADKSKDSFIFSLSNNDKFTLKKPEYAIFNHVDYGPCFGEYGLNLYVYQRGNTENTNGAQFGDAYQNSKYRKGERETKVRFCGDPGNPYTWYHPSNPAMFKVKQWEVWKLDFQ